MKKRVAALLLALAVLALLAGFAAGQKGEAKEPVPEPDTTARTLIRAIGKNQQVAYRFHTELVNTWDDGEIGLAVFDRDAEAFDQADNWCTTRVGDAPWLGQSFQTFRCEHGPDTPEENRRSSSSFFGSSDPKWLMGEKPYDSIEKVKAADMALTFTRSGEQLRVTLEIDGAMAWKGQQSIKNMSGETVYLYLYGHNRVLSNIRFQDMGAAGLLLPGWVQFLFILGLLVASFMLHRLAKKGEDKIFIISDLAFLFTTGFFMCIFVFVLTILGRSHSNLLSTISLGCIPVQMQAEGPGFWIPAAVSGAGTVGLLIFLIWLALNESGKPLVYLLASSPLGLCHSLCYGCIVLAILMSLAEILQLITTVAAIAFLGFIVAGLGKPNKKYKEVLTTTRFYNSAGNLVDAKFDIDYVEVSEEKDNQK